MASIEIIANAWPVRDVLPLLLTDRSAKKNIIFATDSYADRGEGYGAKNQITEQVLSYAGRCIIQPRVLKDAEEQLLRTRKKAEVFTPAWVCCLMNNYADEEWFGRSDVFGQLKDQEWTPTEDPIEMPKRKRWQTYVDSRRLEITCGEAPYLVSRYDMATGEIIPIKDRIGILDRKLRIVNENAATEEEWLKWTLRAFQAVYGYEYQGDNLLVARINLLLTYIDYMQGRWDRKPTKKELEEVAKVISWNLWQMDGLKGSIPLGALYEQYHQLTIFDIFGMDDSAGEDEPEEYIPCRIYDWRGQNKSIDFNAFRERRNGSMKFDFVIGNPPYQEESTTAASTSNGQKPMTNIFHKFQLGADDVAGNTSVLIYPAGRWIHRSGKGLADFGMRQINDPHLVKVIFFANAKDVFPGVAIADGISVVVKDKRKTEPGFEYVYVKDGRELTVHMDNPGEALIPLNPRDMIITDKIAKFVQSNHLDYLHDGILPRTLFGIESDFVETHPGVLRPFDDGSSVDYRKEIKIFTNDKAGKSGRARWFVGSRDIVKSNPDMIDEYQVVVSSANAGGQKRDNQLEIMDNHSVFGRARVALRSFKTMKEAKNFYDYVSTYTVRFAFLMTDEALSSLGKRVPDLLDYSDKNKLVDFNKDLDAQLQRIIGFDADDIAYIHERVDGVRGK